MCIRDRYEFRIKDNGIGMSQEFAQKIFEPFERERTSTVSRIQGTGLGMAITKNIVDMMGGTIKAVSYTHLFSLHDAAPLKDSLMNLALTNEAGAVYNRCV